MIILRDTKPFSSGGNRVCHVHPANRQRCLKTFRPDRTPRARRTDKGFPSSLRPLSSFDENLAEANVIDFLRKHFPPEVLAHIPRSYGIVATDLGPAHETDLIRNEDGRISQTLEQHLWDFGLDPRAHHAIETFLDDWGRKPPKTRDLIPHNLVLRLTADAPTLILIDGLGRLTVSSRLYLQRRARMRYERRKTNFQQRIDKILRLKAAGSHPKERVGNLIREL